MYTCASCTIHGCESADHGALPKNCPIRENEKMAEILARYENVKDFFASCAAVEAEGYCQWPRLRETIELCKKMGYEHIGLAFCGGFKKEAKIVEDILRGHGFRVSSVICKAGGVAKEDMGLGAAEKVNPEKFEPMCNPIGQAQLLNDDKTQFNIVLGLCVGHDSLFLQNAKALSTVLVAKDRAMGHNPCAAIYTAHSYSKGKL